MGQRVCGTNSLGTNRPGTNSPQTLTNRPILVIFHDTIFSGGPWPRDKIYKWSSSLKMFQTAGLGYTGFSYFKAYKEAPIKDVPMWGVEVNKMGT